MHAWEHRGRTAPRRPFVLALGEWGQIRYMGRLMKYWTNVTYYERWVCNIGWFPTLSSRVFIETQPRRRYDSFPDVW
jgi:hypothetical protein